MKFAVITSTINVAIDKKVREDYNQLLLENNNLRKAMMEQQKFLERVHTDKVRNNIFITDMNTLRLNDANAITQYILKSISPTIVQNDYKILKAFESREGEDRHSVKLTVNNGKKKILENKNKIKDLVWNIRLCKVSFMKAIILSTCSMLIIRFLYKTR